MSDRKKCSLILFVWLIIFLVIVCTGCVGNKKEPRFTEAEWVMRFKPADVNEANAIAILRTKAVEAETKAEIAKAEAKAKIAARKQVEQVKLGCLLLLGGSVLALVMGTKSIKTLGVAGIVTAVVVWVVISASDRYEKEIAQIGLVILVVGGLVALVFFGYTAWQKFVKDRAFREVVAGGERFKLLLKKDTIGAEAFRDSHDTAQSKSTQKLVKKVKEKL